MTSRQQSITSMISVVAEGRCALLATYQIFQFIVGYAMAQAFAVNLMYTHALQLGNYQFLIQVRETAAREGLTYLQAETIAVVVQHKLLCIGITFLRLCVTQQLTVCAVLQDLFYITILAALMGYTEPRKTLARDKPVGRVLSLPLILSLLLQIAVVVVFQVSMVACVTWYLLACLLLEVFLLLHTQGLPAHALLHMPFSNMSYCCGLLVSYAAAHWGVLLCLQVFGHSSFAVSCIASPTQCRQPPKPTPYKHANRLTGACAVVVMLMQLVALGAMHRIPWYKPTVGTPDLRTYSAPETTVIYLVNLAQFVILGAVFNKGYPHRCVLTAAVVGPGSPPALLQGCACLCL